MIKALKILLLVVFIITIKSTFSQNKSDLIFLSISNSSYFKSSVKSFDAGINYDNFKPKDTVKKKKHSRMLAGWLSAALPGLGQAYNRKYWKIPIVYAGAGAFAYFIIHYHGLYKQYHNSFRYKNNLDPDGYDEFPYYSVTQVEQNMEFYHRNLELTCMFAGLWYILNIVDAVVDAYLIDWNVSDDLSLRVEPGMYSIAPNSKNSLFSGAKLTLKF